MSNPTPMVCLLSLMLVLGSRLVHAEVGDYSALQTSLNKIVPKPADRPITSADRRLVPLPINQNPTGFQDGFDPKKYETWPQG